MKQKLLLLLLLPLTIANATPKAKAITNPLIGVMMAANWNSGNMINFSIKIKNTGDEVLNNIYFTGDPNIDFNGYFLPTLAPGEEITDINVFKYGGPFCFDLSQIMVHATPTSSSNEITDLSSDPNGYDINNLPGSYYNDIQTFSSFTNNIYAYQDGIYQDLNNNSIIDVGDVINYTYYFYSQFPVEGQIYDNNAIIADPSFYNVTTWNTTGIHYITQAEATLGYVYNSSSISTLGPCDYSYINDYSPCSCPNPSGANIITPLTSDLPNRISGTAKFNVNNDNCATGLSFPNRRITTTDGTFNYSTFTNASGGYHILIPNAGNYTTSALANLNANFSSTPPSVTVTSSGSGVDYNNTDFCIGSATNYTDVSVNMFNINQAIPGNAATYRITYVNDGSTNLNGSIELTFDNGKLSFGSASPAQSSSTASTLTWNYTNLLPFERRYIDLTLNVLPTTGIGNPLVFAVTANPITGDDMPANNYHSWTQTVRSSFDPNDKTVIEGNVIDIGQTGNYLHYVTRFQNTGTANATTVVIKETLDPKLDWNTFEPIASSHNSNIQVKNGNEVTYTFSNINLAYESANEPASHGWMAYRIKPKQDIALWDIMSSKSDIYFDYNAPIITNTVTTQVTALGTTDFIKSNFAVYPNPASTFLTIEAKIAIESNYEIVDINGKSLLKGITQNLQPINIGNLESGFYFLTLTTQEGKATYKIIKN